MAYWDQKVKIILQDSEGNDRAAKNRFPPSEPATAQSLPAILARLQSGQIQFDSLAITVRGVQRDDAAVLFSGRNEVVSERDQPS